MSAGVGEPIPWSYTDMPGVLLWSWVTDHFVARIAGLEVDAREGQRDDTAGVDAPGVGGGGEALDRRRIRSYTWDVSDLMRTHQGLPRLLVDGTSSSFDEAERLVREHVGKLYDARLGYRAFSGSLAYLFTLSTGERIDVRPFMGTRCTVTVLMPDRSERVVTGDFDVRHYHWQVSTAQEILDIVPEHVLAISNRSDAAERASVITRNSSYSGIGRIYLEDPRPGCTGRAGFSLGTVDHAGAVRCPLHEEGLPEHLLH